MFHNIQIALYAILLCIDYTERNGANPERQRPCNSFNENQRPQTLPPVKGVCVL